MFEGEIRSMVDGIKGGTSEVSEPEYGKYLESQIA